MKLGAEMMTPMMTLGTMTPGMMTTVIMRRFRDQVGKTAPRKEYRCRGQIIETEDGKMDVVVDAADDQTGGQTDQTGSQTEGESQQKVGVDVSQMGQTETAYSQAEDKHKQKASADGSPTEQEGRPRDQTLVVARAHLSLYQVAGGHRMVDFLPMVQKAEMECSATITKDFRQNYIKYCTLVKVVLFPCSERVQVRRRSCVI